MQVGHLRKIFEQLKDDDVVAVVIYTIDDAIRTYDPIAGDSVVEDNWKYIVDTFESDGELNAVADTCFDEAIYHNIPSKDDR